MNDAASAALSPESFSALALFLRADWVIKGVMLGLLGASLWSWSVIIDTLLKFRTLAQDADQIEDAIAAGRSLEEVAEAAGPEPRQALARLLQSALRTWYEARANDGISEAKAGFILQRVDRGLDGIIARESEQAEEGLSGLAIVATASPFIGLFGTVWGIMQAFQAIAVQKNTNLSVVAPSIAEALFATAIGLVAAIPAYIAYNKFSTDAGKFSGRLEGFADDLSTAIQRRVADKV